MFNWTSQINAEPTYGIAELIEVLQLPHNTQDTEWNYYWFIIPSLFGFPHEKENLRETLPFSLFFHTSILFQPAKKLN